MQQRGQLCTAGGALPPPHCASYQVAHSCCQITPLLAARSLLLRLLPLLKRLWFLCSTAPAPIPTDKICPSKKAAQACIHSLFPSQPGPSLNLTPGQGMSSPGESAHRTLLVRLSFRHRHWAEVPLVGSIRLLEAELKWGLCAPVSFPGTRSGAESQFLREPNSPTA